MRDALDPGVRYELDAAPKPAPASAPTARPVASYADPVVPAGIDWNAGAGEGWGVTPVPVDGARPVKNAASNFAAFSLKLLDKAKAFDGLGRALLGKDKGR